MKRKLAYWCLEMLYVLVTRVYNVFMKTFIAQNGREVAKFVTPSGVTAYVDTAIPMEAIEAFKKKMARIIARQDAADKLLHDAEHIRDDEQE